ncbi:MAG: PLP-dependent cysteine synthase family protein [Pseudonocardiaceae bacterium]
MEPHAAPEPNKCEPTGHLEDLDSPRPINSEWTRFKLARLNNDPDLQPKWTEMLDYPLLSERGIKLKFKIEVEQPSGSHKHRLAKALYVHALANGWIKNPPNGGSPVVVEASSGSTAISEAWYAKELGIRFIAVVPTSTSKDKKDAIERLGGEVVNVDDPTQIYNKAENIAKDKNGHYMDQFTYAERAYDWHGGGLAKEIFEQVEEGPPAWFVIGGGTGGTAAVFSRYARAHNKTTKLCMPDPENSAFFCGWRDNNRDMTGKGSLIEGIGRPRIEPSFIFNTVDRMMQVPNAASLAAMTVLDETEGFPRPGGSSGTHFLSALKIIKKMRDAKQTGTVVTVLCDSGNRYTDTYYNPDWYTEKQINIEPWKTTITNFLKTGTWNEPTTPVPASTYATIWDNV